MYDDFWPLYSSKLSAVGLVSSNRVSRQSIRFQRCQPLSHLQIFHQQFSDPRIQLRDRHASFQSSFSEVRTHGSWYTPSTYWKRFNLTGPGQAAGMNIIRHPSVRTLQSEWRCGGGGSTMEVRSVIWEWTAELLNEDSKHKLDRMDNKKKLDKRL